MTPVEYHGGKVRLYPGDCLEALKGLPSDSVDAVVTDPPYALVSIVKRFGKEGSAPAQGDVYARASAGFMGQAWDTGETAFAVEFWREVYRVLRPGGHVAAFGGTRTYHELTTAIAGAGFEVRDRLTWIICSDTHVANFLASLSDEQQRAFVRCIEESQFGGELAWIFGSGFPKNHDVAKGIDKRRVEDVEPIRVVCRFVRAAMDARGLVSRQLVEHFGGCNARLIDHWAARDTDSQPSLPTPGQWATLKAVLSLSDEMDAEVARLNARKGEHSDDWKSADVIGQYEGTPGGFGDKRFEVREDVIRALSPEAEQWQGWGTALKPALEPIALARKPLIGTVAENVLAHGTGAINVDACRVENGEAWSASGDLAGGANEACYGDGLNNAGRSSSHALGRWPANVLHDGSDEVLAAFPSEAGAFAPVRGLEPSAITDQVYRARSRTAGAFHADTGSAARFFYSAKADADDRIGSKHPTVKPVDLMRWLVRLLCPPGGTVLDPFAGTGTTGEAAFREGFSSVLCEREPAYLLDIARRMDLITAGPAIRRAERAKARGKAPKPAPLFGEP